MELNWQENILNDINRYYRLAFCYVKNRQDANDIIQEALYKALKNEHKLNNINAVRTWFYRIVVNTSLDFVKKANKVVYFDSEQWGDIVDEGKDDGIELRELVDKLPFKYKTVIVLRYFEDMKINEIAGILNENQNTIKSRIYTALKKLKIQLEEEIKYV